LPIGKCQCIGCPGAGQKLIHGTKVGKKRDLSKQHFRHAVDVEARRGASGAGPIGALVAVKINFCQLEILVNFATQIMNLQNLKSLSHA
ncbi:MAG: hypothetical protein K2K99_09125, partial [Muribaculaceae bacterium]|nr:hypothetical protein [Muribaculaceae bacterium]